MAERDIPAVSEPKLPGDKLGLAPAECESCIRKPSLWLSGVIAILAICLHAFFAFHGMEYNMPDIVWALILAPWVGLSASKLTRLVKREKAN